MRRAGEPLLIPMPGWSEPLEVLPAFSRDPMPVLLYSGGPASAGPDINRWSILCSMPFEVVSWRSGDPGDPFLRLAEATGRHASGRTDGIPFAGGAVGYIGYDAGRCIESMPARAAPGLELPDLLFGLYSWAVIWDHQERVWAILSTGLPETGAARGAKAASDARRVAQRLDRIDPRVASGAADLQPKATRLDSSITSNLSRPAYLEMVEEARRLIADGELYQVNLSQRFELPAPRDPVRLFSEIARHSPAPFSAYLDAGAFQVLSASPERFLRLRGREAQSRPIKGTRPRGATPREDRALREELAASVKDTAENIMIVDLVRNDLGRVCEAGTVKALEVCRLETYASVHHLVSVVTGELRDGIGGADLLKALFPAGSMTGAPKVRAMRAIEEIEPDRRGIYAGALGYLSFCGAIDLSVVIRTAIVARARTWLQVGGGVVADSDPEAEYAESLDKAASVLRAVSATECLPGLGRRASGRASLPSES